MPSYEKRCDEIEKALRETTAFPADQAGTALSRVISLFDGRDQALTAMQAVMTTDGPEPMADDYKEKAALALDRWITPLSKLLDGVTAPDKGLDGWREATAAMEGRFFGGLDAVGLGVARDQLAAFEAGLEKLSKDLQLKWDTMSESAKRLEAQEAEAGRKMSEIIQTSMHGGVDAWAKYGEALRRFIEKANTIPDLVNESVVYLLTEAGLPEGIAKAVPTMSLLGKDYFKYGKEELGITAKDLAKYNPELIRDPGMAVSETVQKALGPEFEMLISSIQYLYKYVLPVASGEYYEQMGNYQKLIPNEGAILVSLGQTRRDVDDFLKNNGLDKARDVFERTINRMNEWGNGLPTDGQKADARAWGTPVADALKTRYERMANAFGMFVQANQGRFIGTPSKSVENDLIFTDVWADREHSLMDIGMDTRIKEWRAGTMSIGDQMATASSQLFSGLRNLPRDLSDPITAKLNEYWAKLRDQVAREATVANDTLGKAAEKIDRDQIHRDLDRRPLQAMLTA